MDVDSDLKPGGRTDAQAGGSHKPDSTPPADVLAETLRQIAERLLAEVMEESK